MHTCVESTSLLTLLLQAYRAELAPAVVQMLGTASEGCPPGAPSRLSTQNGSAPNITAGIPSAVLHKEAVYAAVGTGAYDLFDFIDFQPWLRTTLVQVNSHNSTDHTHDRTCEIISL